MHQTGVDILSVRVWMCSRENKTIYGRENDREREREREREMENVCIWVNAVKLWLMVPKVMARPFEHQETHHNLGCSYTKVVQSQYKKPHISKRNQMVRFYRQDLVVAQWSPPTRHHRTLVWTQSVWPDKNDFTRKMIGFNTFTKNCLRMWAIWAN